MAGFVTRYRRASTYYGRLVAVYFHSMHIGIIAASDQRLLFGDCFVISHKRISSAQSRGSAAVLFINKWQ